MVPNWQHFFCFLYVFLYFLFCKSTEIFCSVDATKIHFIMLVLPISQRKRFTFAFLNHVYFTKSGNWVKLIIIHYHYNIQYFWIYSGHFCRENGIFVHNLNFKKSPLVEKNIIPMSVFEWFNPLRSYNLPQGQHYPLRSPVVP